MNTISFFVNFLRLSANAKKTRGEILSLREKALRKMLRFAFENSVYYRRTFSAAGITGRDIASTPISKFPTIDKSLLMKNFDEIVTRKELRQSEIAAFAESEEARSGLFKNRYRIVHSSGSTGVPRYFVYDRAAWNKMLLGITRGALWDMAAGEIFSLLRSRPKILYVAATDGLYGGAMAVGDGIRNIRAGQVFLDIGEPLEKWRDVLRAYKFDIIIGYPSAIKILCEKFSEELSRLKLRRVVSCGEPLPPSLRNYIAQKTACDVINFYGASESLALGVEHHPADGMLLFDDLNLIEIEGGKMFVTCLYNFSQPLIRYHITDSLEFLEHTEQSKFGFTKARVVLSRDEDILWFQDKDGGSHFLHPLSVEGLCAEGLIDCQFVRKSNTNFVVRIQIRIGADEKSVSGKIRETLDALILQKRMDFVHYKIEAVSEIRPDPKTGKKRLIVTQEM